MTTSADILTLAAQFRQQMLTADKAALARLTTAFRSVWEKSRAELARLTAEMQSARDRGETVSEGWLFERDRLAALLAQVEAQLGTYAQAALGEMTTLQAEMAVQGEEATAALAREETADVRVTLQRLPTEAVAELVGILGDGSPLQSILGELAQIGSSGMEDALIRGVALGWNPRRIEREAQVEMGKVLSRALTVARTEALRSYRTAQQQSMLANKSVLGGWIWLSAADTRTCPSCWAMHGTRHALDERLNDHPNGRCTAVPIAKGFTLNVPTGVERFAKLDPAQQRRILGDARYEAFAEGRIGLQDMVHTHDSRTWGSHRRAATLAQALASAN